MKLKRILLAVRDLKAPPRAALRKAAALARASGAAIELFHALTEPASATATAAPARTRGATARSASAAEPLAQAHARLERLANSSILAGSRVRSQVVADRPAHEAIIRRAVQLKADLVVAATQAHGYADRLFLRNTDWELIRHCPCPLLLVKARRQRERPLVLVAVDPFHAHDKPARLDADLLSAGADLARLTRGTLHAFHAYMPLVAGVEAPFGELLTWQTPEIEAVHLTQVQRAFDRLCQRADVPPARRHLEMGDVAGELRASAAQLRAGVVVMGAVSRSRLGRVLIGSTAERVLDHLSCDVLVIKPRGFKSGVPLRVRGS